MQFRWLLIVGTALLTVSCGGDDAGNKGANSQGDAEVPATGYGIIASQSDYKSFGGIGYSVSIAFRSAQPPDMFWLGFNLRDMNDLNSISQLNVSSYTDEIRGAENGVNLVLESAKMVDGKLELKGTFSLDNPDKTVPSIDFSTTLNPV